ncbi:MAG TPA: 2-hydroxychromene-2-carboxylate isomerase [Geminicoccaceae bacterium]|nr:2-hydroxychromene-2-carboxylate isomerase [Geminicoccaceae bacterium]
MGSKPVEVYYTHASPWTYLGWARFRDIVARTGAEPIYRPVSFGEIFPVSGGLPLGQRAPQRRAYRMMELRRWSAHLGVPINLEPRFFPVDDAPAARLAIAHREAGGDPAPLSGAILAAVWTQERDIADPATLGAIANEQGLDGAALLAAAEGEAAAATYRADTQAAIERGVFGAPTFVVGDELFWGQDRLDFVERALRGG